MNNNEVVDAMVQRLGAEIKSLMVDSQEGRLPVTSLEKLVRQKLWHFGAQAMGVLLEARDEVLVVGRAVHDRPTRTVVTLFGPVDVTRSRCAGGHYPLSLLQNPPKFGGTPAVASSESLPNLIERIPHFAQSVQ
jgi:hypothetical protein